MGAGAGSGVGAGAGAGADDARSTLKNAGWLARLGAPSWAPFFVAGSFFFWEVREFEISTRDRRGTLISSAFFF